MVTGWSWDKNCLLIRNVFLNQRKSFCNHHIKKFKYFFNLEIQELKDKAGYRQNHIHALNEENEGLKEKCELKEEKIKELNEALNEKDVVIKKLKEKIAEFEKKEKILQTSQISILFFS